MTEEAMMSSPRVNHRTPLRGILLKGLLAALAVPLVWGLGTTLAVSREAATVIPAPIVDEPLKKSETGPETAVLAGGCFWGVQAVFQHVKGVSQVLSGYSGGTKESADYHTVSSGRTGHAESVEVTFDPSVISYGTILQIYFSVAHNPTELNRQGPDVGTQYRSAIFVKNDEQRRIAESYIAQLDKVGVFRSPIVTKVDNLAGFYTAEAYHQNYATMHPDSPYIAINDLPKVENLKRVFPTLSQNSPVLVSMKGQ
jgi:peptide-methionine (S)-S-oxide reductase